MKKVIILALVCIGFIPVIIAQPPQAFKYQAVVRDASGEIISNETVDIRISIREGWGAGTVIYQETHSVATNQFGLINLSVGWGIPGSGYVFQNIDWSLNEKFIEVEIWDDGLSTYVSMGTSMLFSVPYALYSEDDGDWIRDGDDILAANTGNVGIGSTSLFFKLNVLSPYCSAIRGESTDYNGISGSSAGYHTSGVIGTGETANSYGVYGRNSYGGVAIRGYSSGGLAGHFEGNVYFEDNVGIGTDSPSDLLHLYRNTSGSLGLRISNSDPQGRDYAFRVGGASSSIGAGNLAIYDHSANVTRMVITPDGKVGIGTVSPLHRLDVLAVSSEDAIKGYSPSGTGVWAASATSYGIFGQSSSGWAGYFSGPVHITGNLSKGSGSFVIDHPLDPENKLLRHNFVESPENLLIYRGKADLNANGEAVIEMPDYFNALTKEDEASIHLTPVGRPFLTGAEWNNDFTAIIIYGENNRAVFWEVLADRDDPVIHELGRPVEEEKGGANTLCEKGKLLYPEAYGYPESMGRDYEIKQLNKR